MASMKVHLLSVMFINFTKNSIIIMSHRDCCHSHSYAHIDDNTTYNLVASMERCRKYSKFSVDSNLVFCVAVFGLTKLKRIQRW